MDTPHHLERGETAGLTSSSSSSTTAAVPCLSRHKCHTCERTRSVRVRLLSWLLGKFSLLLIIVITSATTTFLYHRLLPDDISSSSSSRHNGASSSSSSSSLSASSSSSSSSSTSSSLGAEDRHGARHAVMELQKDPPGIGRPHLSAQSAPLTAARLGLQTTKSEPHLSMTSEGSKFFTSGHVALEGGALVVRRATTLFLSADVILKSMLPEGESGPSAVVVCLSLARGHEARHSPISCHQTYLRKRDRQMARVWMLFQAEANDRIYVNTSWPSYVISDNRDNQQSVFQAFEV
ncbi:uncharacterized protein LOC143288899 [Babylonia areolata]|uniref:uncharacterized protein LOC143288899 n=1 Tax=Babylonia areolata TaxID=304850 RepID=UPI003FD459F9